MLTFKHFLVEATVDIDAADISKNGKDVGRARINRACQFDANTVKTLSSYFQPAKANTIKDAYNEFVKAFPKEAMQISNTKPDQVGPGEMVFYYLFDNIGVGKNKAIDLFLDGKEFAEVKAGSGAGAKIMDFEVSPGSDPAVTDLLDGITAFNDAHNDITGDDLPGWSKVGEISSGSLSKWRDIDLGKLGDGKGRSIDLTLKRDGSLVKRGESDPILNVSKTKSIAPLKDLLSSKDADDNNTLTPVIDSWVDSVITNYIGNKRFFMISSTNLLIRFAGNLTKEMIGLYRITRGRPKAEVYLAPEVQG